jgi:hypothetical protein
MAATIAVLSGGQVLAQAPHATMAHTSTPLAPAPHGVPPQAGSSQAGVPSVGAPVPLLPPSPSQRPAPAPNTMVQVPDVMTDSPAYCSSLSDRVGGMARGEKVSPEAAEMAREGQRLCEGGKTRSGIQHLRRAFIMLRDNQDR